MSILPADQILIDLYTNNPYLHPYGLTNYNTNKKYYGYITSFDYYMYKGCIDKKYEIISLSGTAILKFNILPIGTFVEYEIVTEYNKKYNTLGKATRVIAYFNNLPLGENVEFIDELYPKLVYPIQNLYENYNVKHICFSGWYSEAPDLTDVDIGVIMKSDILSLDFNVKDVSLFKYDKIINITMNREEVPKHPVPTPSILLSAMAYADKAFKNKNSMLSLNDVNFLVSRHCIHAMSSTHESYVMYIKKCKNGNILIERSKSYPIINSIGSQFENYVTERKPNSLHRLYDVTLTQLNNFSILMTSEIDSIDENSNTVEIKSFYASFGYLKFIKTQWLQSFLSGTKKLVYCGYTKDNNNIEFNPHVHPPFILDVDDIPCHSPKNLDLKIFPNKLLTSAVVSADDRNDMINTIYSTLRFISQLPDGYHRLVSHPDHGLKAHILLDNDYASSLFPSDEQMEYCIQMSEGQQVHDLNNKNINDLFIK